MKVLLVAGEVPGCLPDTAKVHLNNPNPQIGLCSELATPPGAYPVFSICCWVRLQPVTPTREIAVKKILLFHWPQFKGVFVITTLCPLLKYKPFKYVYIAAAGEPLSEQWLVLWSHQARNSFLPKRMNTFLILLHPPLNWIFIMGRWFCTCVTTELCVWLTHTLCVTSWDHLFDHLFVLFQHRCQCNIVLLAFFCDVNAILDRNMQPLISPTDLNLQAVYVIVFCSL